MSKGVYKYEGRERYTVQIYIDGKTRYLGSFVDEAEAIKVFEAAERDKRKAELEKQREKPTYEERLDMAKETAWMLQRLLCSRWSKINYPYEPGS